MLTSANEIAEDLSMGMSQVTEALTAYADASRAVVHTPEERRAAWKTILDVLDWELSENYDLSDSVHAAVGRLCENAEGTRQLIALLEEIDEAGFADWIAAYYLQLGDDNAYLATRQAHLTTEAQHLELADYWQRHGEPNKARTVLEDYVPLITRFLDQRSQQTGLFVPSSGVLDRLEAIYRDTGAEASLCQILLLQSRMRGLTIERYRQIKALAQSVGNWEALRPVLLDDARRNREMLARIYLLEENWNAALQLVQDKPSPFDFSSYGDNVRSLVARGVKAHRPLEALAILQSLVQSYIDQKNRSGYSIAAGFAADIKDIYRNILHDEGAWQTYITGIQQRYPKHRALQEEFRRL